MIYFIFCLYLVFITSSQTTINWEWKMFFPCNIVIIPKYYILVQEYDCQYNHLIELCIIDREKIEDCFFAGFKLDFGKIRVYLYGYLTVFIQKNA